MLDILLTLLIQTIYARKRGEGVRKDVKYVVCVVKQKKIC